MNGGQGVLILNEVPDQQAEERVIEFLLRHARNASKETLSAMIKHTPVILSRNVTEQTGRKLVAALKKLGASASFVSKESPEELIVPFEQPARDDGHYSDEEESDVEGQAGLLSAYSSKKPFSETWTKRAIEKIAQVNKELWIILSMVSIAGLMNYAVASQYMILGFYNIPTLLSAYFYGRRHAVMTATLTIILVGVIAQFNTSIFSGANKFQLGNGQWYHIIAWGCMLICTAYAMGTLYERHVSKIKELRQTYQGLIVILRHFISKDQYTENHCYRVSIYAAKIASYLGLDEETIEDIRSAALIHDIGKLKVSRELLYKAAKLSREEFEEVKKHVSNGCEMLKPLEGPLARIIPMILAHHDKYDGSGYRPYSGDEIPLGARILAVADAYDAMVSDRPYRKAMSPFEAKEIIAKGSGRDFDPDVVKAFLKAFEMGEMEVPRVVV